MEGTVVNMEPAVPSLTAKGIEPACEMVVGLNNSRECLVLKSCWAGEGLAWVKFSNSSPPSESLF